jgi:ketosteroid isomerase-like protein
MSAMDLSQLHPVFLKQIEALSNNDMDTLMEVYHPDIVSLRFQGPVVGREAARDLLKQYEGLDMEFVGIEEYVHTDDMIMTRTRLRVKGEEVVAFGAYVIKDGMIWRQFGCDEGGVRDWWA